MDPRRDAAAPRWLRRLARFLLRSGDARFIVDDLDELLERDLAGGMPRRRALGRYVRNVLGSAVAIRLDRPSFPRGIGFSGLDVRIGLRMLVRHPGLTLVGGFGIAVAIAVGSVGAASARLVDVPLPFEEGERVVAIEYWDTEINNQERRILHDFLDWRQSLETVGELGAYRLVGRNLITADGASEPVRVAEITASAFDLTRVRPLLGRPLVADDHRPGAPPVVVIGHDIWQGRMGGDPEVIGRELRLGARRHTVVGVMPRGFRFPINDRLWVPLELDASGLERRAGPRIFVFGRLAPEATLVTARAELATVAARAADAFPETHARLNPQVVGYTRQLFDDMEGVEVPLLHTMVALLLVVVCVNVAILVYARTATRGGEMAVRSALGASRRRLVGQLFVEALVLSLTAAGVGFVIAALVLDRLDRIVEIFPIVPFWIEFRLAPGTILYGLGLAALAALIVGALPALRATGNRLLTGLQRTAQGASDARLGRTWTALVVLQVAVTVTLLPIAMQFAQELVAFGYSDPGEGTEGYMVARITVDPASEADTRTPYAQRFRELQLELTRRTAAEGGVDGVTFAAHPPGGETRVFVEVEGLATPTEAGGVRGGTAGHEVRFGRVAHDFFRILELPMLTGRGFAPADAGPESDAVVVSRSFVDGVLGGGNALGRRLRYVGRSGDVADREIEYERWYRIVGVVPDFPAQVEPGRTQAKLYHAIAPGDALSVSLLAHAPEAAPADFAARLRAIAAEVDPTLRLREIRPLAELLTEEHAAMRLAALAIVLVTLSVLLLASAGVYAMMSFAVTRRRREIGIRTALGGRPRRILAAIYARAFRQLGAGATVGILLGTIAMYGAGLPPSRLITLVLAVAAVLLCAGLLATLGPSLRGLRIQPTEALREE